MTDQFFQTSIPQDGANNSSNLNDSSVNSSQSQNFWNAVNPADTASIDTKNNPQNTLEQQKQMILLQQEQIQSKYQQLKDLYQNNQLNIEQKQQIQEQMQKLSDLYTQNKQTLATLAINISGERQVQVSKNVQVKEKKTTKAI